MTDNWRWQAPCSQTKRDKPCENDYEDFELTDGNRWEVDDKHQERCEWAGPRTVKKFDIKINFRLDDKLLIAHPKLTIFQIHCNQKIGDERKSLQPVAMLNLRRRYGDTIDCGVSLSDPSVYLELRFRDPNHHDDRPHLLYLPDLGQGQGVTKSISTLNLAAKANIFDNEMCLNIELSTPNNNAAQFKFKLDQIDKMIEFDHMLEIYPKYGAYRSDSTDTVGFANTARPDQMVSAQLCCYKYD